MQPRLPLLPLFFSPLRWRPEDEHNIRYSQQVKARLAVIRSEKIERNLQEQRRKREMALEKERRTQAKVRVGLLLEWMKGIRGIVRLFFCISHPSIHLQFAFS